MLGVLSLVATPAQADEHAAPAPIGQTTQDWLELQKAHKPQGDETLSGEQAHLIHKRYVDSFGREIPDELRRERGVASGGSR